MPDKKPKDGVEDKDEMQFDQPSVEDPDGREAITHPEETYPRTADTAYRPGDPPPSQSMFPPQKPDPADVRAEKIDDGK